MAVNGEVSHKDSEKDTAYEYLCRLEEARKWLELVLGETLPPAVELEEVLQNGVFLCRLGMKLLPDDPMWRKVYDVEQTRFKVQGLGYRYTDNINFWLSSLKKLGLPKVFYPVMTDIYHRKNMPKLIYCLHALSHLMKKQGKVSHAVDDLYGSAKFPQDAISQTSETLRSRDLPAFGIVENLVEEELQYQAIGISDCFEEDRRSVTASEDGTPPTSPLFDDPAYLSASKAFKERALTPDLADGSNQTGSQPIAEIPCQGSGIRASLYSRKSKKEKINGHFKDDSKRKPLEEAVDNINQALEKDSPQETLKALQHPNANLPFVYQHEAEKYHPALVSEKTQGVPQNVLMVFSGLDRERCEHLLDKMSPGAYIVRSSCTLEGEYVLSFRNLIGLKHWKLSMKNGTFYWGSNPLYNTLDAFIDHFVAALAEVTTLHVYPGMVAVLQPLFTTPEQQLIIDGLRESDNGLTYGQICRVIKDVNHSIRQGRKSFSEESRSKPLKKQLEELQIRDKEWDSSMIMAVTKVQAENVLNKEGHAGSFIVRPSEKTPGDYALAFRTTGDVRHWKIVQDSDKFYVHPRPNPYPNLEGIVQHFKGAVSLETGLTMSPLIRKKKEEQQRGTLPRVESPALSLKRSSGKSSTMGRTAVPSMSLSKLNPANLTSWTVEDVCQWLQEQGLGRFIDIFQENAVDGECLLTLDNNLLKEDLDISALGHRSRILKRVQALKESVHPELS